MLLLLYYIITIKWRYKKYNFSKEILYCHIIDIFIDE